MSSLPLVLAGPILKSATERELNIWICTSEKIDSGLSASLYQKNAQDFESIQTITTSNELHIAPAVFIYLIHIATTSDNTPLPRGVFIYYDLYPKDTPNKEKGAWLEKDGLLNNILFEKTDILPNYILQNRNEDLRIIMGSCRKAHGENYKPKDAIQSILKKSKKVSDSWPHAFLLAGDQIYADDVATLVSLFISEKLIPLLLKSDSWLKMALPESLTENDFKKYRYWRKELFKNKGKSKETEKYSISSDEANNHLIMWCEFIALYLIHWNGDLIDSLGQFRSAKEAMSVIENYPEPVTLFDTLTREENSLKEPAIKEKPVTEKEPPDKGGFAAESNAYRKLMAHIPTYMLGDDHEVTDDWNFDSKWMSNAKNNELAEEVIINGQLAYTIFQVLGNSYENSIQILFRVGSVFSQGNAKVDIKSIKSVLAESSFKQLYHSITETQPPILLVDTRVGRSIIEKDYTLLSYAQYSYVIDLRESYKCYKRHRDVSYCGDSWDAISKLLGNRKSKNGNSIVLVLAAPVFVPKFIEKLQAISDTIFGEDFADSEGWKTYPSDMVKLFSIISRSGIKNLTILAGDIHCAYWSKSVVETDAGEIKVAQLVSSGLKNSNSNKLAGFEHTFGTRHNYFSYFESNNSGFMFDFTEHYRPSAPHLDALKSAVGFLKDNLICQTSFEEFQSGGRRMYVEYNGLSVKIDPTGAKLEFQLFSNDGEPFNGRCEHSSVKNWW